MSRENVTGKLDIFAMALVFPVTVGLFIFRAASLLHIDQTRAPGTDK